ncbi:MAG: D-amino acid dehydrogenase [Mesorhizobium sp.]|nr:D-amino acid dehydrogenase [Mesorhizobium sp.]
MGKSGKQRVVILGGGIVGVTTAYQLLRDGHEVVLIEQRESVGEETSWGNAGMIAPGHSFAWASPQAPMTLLKSLFDKDQALRFTPSLDPRLWMWSAAFLRECTSARATRNTLIKHRLTLYSQGVFQETAAETGVDFDRSSNGILYFYSTDEGLKRGVEHMKILSDNGQKIEVVDRARIEAIDPSFAASKATIAGGIYCPTDETGDCSKFAKALAALCVERGADIRTGTRIKRIVGEAGRISHIETDQGEVRGDLYVLSLGNHSPILARDIGVYLPIYPIKGYSLTIPVGNRPHPPKLACVDEDRLVAITRMGDRVRATATAEFAGYDTGHKPSDFSFMRKVVEDLFPEGADFERAEYWAGLRPMTPKGIPILGHDSKFANLFMNTGQGHMGWTMSHACARITADMIAGRTPAIPLEGLTRH